MKSGHGGNSDTGFRWRGDLIPTARVSCAQFVLSSEAWADPRPGSRSESQTVGVEEFELVHPGLIHEPHLAKDFITMGAFDLRVPPSPMSTNG